MCIAYHPYHTMYALHIKRAAIAIIIIIIWSWFLLAFLFYLISLVVKSKVTHFYKCFSQLLQIQFCVQIITFSRRALQIGSVVFISILRSNRRNQMELKIFIDCLNLFQNKDDDCGQFIEQQKSSAGIPSFNEMRSSDIYFRHLPNAQNAYISFLTFEFIRKFWNFHCFIGLIKTNLWW